MPPGMRDGGRIQKEAQVPRRASTFSVSLAKVELAAEFSAERSGAAAFVGVVAASVVVAAFTGGGFLGPVDPAGCLGRNGAAMLSINIFQFGCKSLQRIFSMAAFVTSSIAKRLGPAAPGSLKQP